MQADTTSTGSRGTMRKRKRWPSILYALGLLSPVRFVLHSAHTEMRVSMIPPATKLGFAPLHHLLLLLCHLHLLHHSRPLHNQSTNEGQLATAHIKRHERRKVKAKVGGLRPGNGAPCHCPAPPSPPVLLHKMAQTWKAGATKPPASHTAPLLLHVTRTSRDADHSSNNHSKARASKLQPG